MRQLYSNNAKTTLVTGVSSTDISFTLVDASKFPTPGANEYFLATLEVDGQIEIIRVISRAANVLNISVVGNRAQEGTTAFSFPAGARIECRITKETLDKYSKAFIQLGGVELMVAPSAALNDGYICSTFDPQGNPVLAVRKDDNSWRFLNYTVIQNCVRTASTTTSVDATSVSTPAFVAGKYLVQITSGILTGYVRSISASTATQISWASALPSAPAAGVTFEILEANSSILLDTLAIGDDALIMPLILGGE